MGDENNVIGAFAFFLLVAITGWLLMDIDDRLVLWLGKWFLFLGVLGVVGILAVILLKLLGDG